MTEQKPKIFLSYAHEDIGMAKRLYQDLKRFGLDIWIDCESLLPGQNWKITIEKTIKQSQYYLLLLSSHSITKRGFIQKEMKIAYEVLENCSEEDIYLIPVRLNECEPSFKISDIHYINVFPESEYQNGLKKILQIVSSRTFLLRSKPKDLSMNEIVAMIRMHDFFEKNRNPDGKGVTHKYTVKNIYGDKIIFDEFSCLMWQYSGSNERMSFKDAKKWIIYINRKSFAGFTDWRLPTLEEAMSLMEPEKKMSDSYIYQKDLYINPIFCGHPTWIWTADHGQGESRAVWIVNFENGDCDWDSVNSKFHVRAVRFGQLFP